MKNKYRTLCIFSSFDKNSFVRPYVYHLVQNLHSQLDCTKFLFISTSEILDARDIARLKSIGIEAHKRENTGYDFGSYFFGLDLEANDLIQYDRIFFVNDSIYGPFNKINNLTDRFDQFDYWGLTDSWQHAYHLQSYFLCINKTAFKELLEFKHRYKFPNDYKQVVLQGEVGLSQYFLSKGKNLCCTFPTEQLIGYKTATANQLTKKPKRLARRLYANYFRKKVLNINPCSVFWRLLLEQGHPFLKRKHFTDDATMIEHCGEWTSKIDRQYTDAMQAMYSNIVTVRSAAWPTEKVRSFSKILFLLKSKMKKRRYIDALSRVVKEGS